MHRVRMKGVLLHLSANSSYESSSKRRISFAAGILDTYLAREMWLQTKGRWRTSEKTLVQSTTAARSGGSRRHVDLHDPSHWNSRRFRLCDLYFWLMTATPKFHNGLFEA